MTNKILKLFANCKTVSGYKRSILIDFHFKCYYFLPNQINNIISQKYIDLQNISAVYKEKDVKHVAEYIDYLKSKQTLFECDIDEVDFFIDIPMDVNIPYLLHNIIIEINDNYINEYIDNINTISCKHIQLKWYKHVSIEKIKFFLNKINNSFIKSVDVVFPLTKEFDFSIVEKMLYAYKRIFKIYITDCEQNKDLLKIPKEYSKNNIILVNHKVSSNQCCGFINKKNFIIDLPFFNESLQFNTCLNRKICIDSEGYIKNCPSMQHHYGHITETTLAEAIDKQGFKDCWFIKKDDIDVCQDCEFRHICTDCRAFIKDPNNIYSQPAKCGYNPYIAKWQNEEGWISVEQWRKENPEWEKQAIELRELHKKYIAINE